MPTAANYNPSNNPNSLVFDSSLRTISNLLVDQTLGNPSAILTALQNAGSANQMTDLAAVSAIYQTFKPASDAEVFVRVAMQNAKAAADALGDGDTSTPATPAEHGSARRVSERDSGPRCDGDGAERGARRPRCRRLGLWHRNGRRQRPSSQPGAGRRPVGSVQLVVHAVRPVLRSRPRSRQQRRQRHGIHSPGSRTIRSTCRGSRYQLHGADPCHRLQPGTDGIMRNAGRCPSGQHDDCLSSIRTRPIRPIPSHQVFLRQYAVGGDGKPGRNGQADRGR